MNVLVTGGTGDLGRALVPKLVAAGHTVRSASRRPPRDPYQEGGGVTWQHVDLATGEGLDEAVRGVEAIVHAASDPLGKVRETDLEGSRRLLEEAKAAGVQHAIFVSITGIENVPYVYYRTKVAVERLFAASGVPYSILRAAQFPTLFERVLTPLSRSPILPLPLDFRFQPVDTDVVADRLVQAVNEGARGRLPDLAGPEVLTVREIATAWLYARGLRRLVVPLPLWGKVPAAFQAGAVTNPSAATPGPTYYDWLERTYGRRPPRPERTGQQQVNAEPAWARLMVALIGLSYVLAGALLLWATPWFYEHVGTFPPYNRHYAGDAGAFNLPLGLGLVWAARGLRRHRALIVIGLIASALHTLNHAYDDALDGAALAHWAWDVGPLALAAVLLALAPPSGALGKSAETPRPSRRGGYGMDLRQIGGDAGGNGLQALAPQARGVQVDPPVVGVFRGGDEHAL
ncbi:MAG TPA: NAD(P)H-binding protein [Chloroflexota bacterium]|nr:NAD(P)H-binding protein [Chloroflexota bacterium]